MPRSPLSKEQTITDMCASAQSVLEAHNIFEPPVNIYQILKDERIPVDFVNFKSDKLEGLYIKDVTGVGIAINANHHPVKKRFTGAHELKHHRHDTPGLMCNYDSQSDKIEKRANRFAAELLIPTDMLQLAINELSSQELLTTTALASVFHVSYDAMVYRLHTLGHFTASQRDKSRKPEERQSDKLKALANQNSRKAANLRGKGVIATFASSHEFSYCRQCSSLIIHEQWTTCYSCGCDYI